MDRRQRPSVCPGLTRVPAMVLRSSVHWNNRSVSNPAGFPIEKRYSMSQSRESSSTTGLHTTGLVTLRMSRSPLPTVSEVLGSGIHDPARTECGVKDAFPCLYHVFTLRNPIMPLRRGGSDE